MFVNKLVIAKHLEKAVLSQPDLRDRDKIADMLWFLTDEPDNYDVAAEVRDMIKKERLRHGMSQTKLAQRAGMAQGRISDFSNGVRVPQLDHLQKIAHGLGMRLVVSFEELPAKK